MNTRERELRQNATEAEKRLWTRQRNRQLDGLKFRRQVPMGRYIADFLCKSEKVIIELDGGQHAMQTEQDAERTRTMEAMGYIVLRFWNNDALGNTDGVLTEILATVRRGKPLSHGERDLG